jgi:hypothetical protein
MMSYLSPNHESRQGTEIGLIGLHTQEAHGTDETLAVFLDNPQSQVSYHFICDDDSGIRIVEDSEAAWCMLGGNYRSLNLCFAGSAASWSRADWLSHDNMLRIGAKQVADWCAAYGIPMTRLDTSQVRTGKGIIDHYQWTIGAQDGTHTDVGNGFPWDVFLGYVTGGAPVAQAAPVPAPSVPSDGSFPLSGSEYFGPLTGPADSISGMAGSDANYQPAIRACQQKLIDLGYGNYFQRYGADGQYGNDVNTSELGQATLQFQKDHPPLSVDGGVGRETWDAIFSASPVHPPVQAPAPAPVPGVQAPGFPLQGSQYYGPLNGPADSISGMAGSDSWAQDAIRMCQQRLIDIGYGRYFQQYGADGQYGADVQTSELGQATIQFQRDHPPLSIDGGIGRKTWDAIFA